MKNVFITYINIVQLKDVLHILYLLHIKIM